MLKCFFESAGEIRAIPIYTPIQLTNVQSDTYLQTLMARFEQAKRHFYGSADVGYSLYKSLATKPRSLQEIFDRIWMIYLVLEAHLVGTLSAYFFLFGIPLMQLFALPRLPEDSSMRWLAGYSQVVSLLAALAVLLMIIKFWRVESNLQPPTESLNASNHQPKLPLPQHSLIRRLLDLVWFPFSGLLYLTIPSTYAALRTLITKRATEYIVAEKKVTKLN
jgi:hypothetical protein